MGMQIGIVLGLLSASLFGASTPLAKLMLGLRRSDAATAALLLNVEGLATMGIAWVVFRENADRRLFIGAFAILAGAVVLSLVGRVSLDRGSGA